MQHAADAVTHALHHGRRTVRDGSRIVPHPLGPVASPIAIVQLLQLADPNIDDATVRAVLRSWGPGKFDAEPPVCSYARTVSS